MQSPKSSFPVKAVFATVLALTLSSGGAALHLANQPTLTEAQTRIFNSFVAMWTTGATALIGLLGFASTSNNTTPRE